MENLIQNIALLVLLTPLLGSIISGVFQNQVGKKGAAYITIAGVGISLLGALWLWKIYVFDGADPYNANLYMWGDSGQYKFHVGLLIDKLTILMMMVVTFVSFLVHIYTIGYMYDDPRCQRFYSYMSLFTFGMLSLVAANNFLQLFFGWEMVGLVSYLLIGYWYKKDSAAAGSLKAFLVNRVGDFGFLLGIGMVLFYFGSLDYADVFRNTAAFTDKTLSILPGYEWNVLTVICILLFVGAMGKSAQIPLHVWLPDSMEGPTPISALIHAATMVTAGVFMVARMSPIYSLSPTAMGVVLIFGATGALFLGLLAVVENDIKRIIAFSTMSQLGYMMAANGAGAYAAGIFHLGTHACFKALLFLGAGSVIIAMHHEQDIRKMGNLRKYLPITYITFLVGTLAITAIPPFSGYYSKDAIIEALENSVVPGAHYGYWCLLIGAFVTALYSFRSLFLTFFTEERMSAEVKKHLHESPKVVTFPLIMLAIPSAILGLFTVVPVLYAKNGFLSQAIFVPENLDVLAHMREEFTGLFHATWHAVIALPFWFTLAGIATAWYCYIIDPSVPKKISEHYAFVYKALINRYGIDKLNDWIFVKGTNRLSRFFYYFTDLKIIDGWMVNGSGKNIYKIATLAKRLQTGYLFHYAFAMIIGLFGLLLWLII